MADTDDSSLFRESARERLAAREGFVLADLDPESTPGVDASKKRESTLWPRERRARRPAGAHAREQPVG